MEKGIWLSYDLGIQGDYNHMYAWLDNHGAVECGDSMAFLHYSTQSELNDEAFLDSLRSDLIGSIAFKPGDRVYVVRRVEERDTFVGKFLIGKRKSSPWEGYGDKGGDDSEDGKV